MCELKTTESINTEDCDQYKIIAGWYWQLINGLRDKPGEDDDDYEDGDSPYVDEYLIESLMEDGYDPFQD